MATLETEFTIDNLDPAIGTFTLLRRLVEVKPGEEGEEGPSESQRKVLSLHREPRAPGHWEGSTWVPTDLSGDPALIRDQAAELWTPEVIAAYQSVRPAPPPPTREELLIQVRYEKDRRLAAGFDYDFGDERGVHHIGTTEADMIGWDEVTKGAAALMATGAPDGEITIVTDTGPAVVTAAEWQQILLAAMAHRQPIWLAAITLEAMDPIPDDPANEVYWT